MRATGDLPAWERAAITGPDTESYLDTALTKGKYYHYMIRAFNDLGSSPFTDSVTVHTLGVWTLAPSYFRPEIFPNPLSGDELVIRTGGTGEKQVRVIDLSGRCVYEASTTGEEFRVSRSSLFPGQFMIILDTPDGSSATGLVVL